MGDIFGDARISNTLWVLEISNIFFFFFFFGGGGVGEVNGKWGTRAYI